MRYVRFLSLSLETPPTPGCEAAAGDDDVVTAASRTDDGDSDSTPGLNRASSESTAHRSVARHSRLSINAAPPASNTSTFTFTFTFI